jgi:hypothetical protein
MRSQLRRLAPLHGGRLGGHAEGSPMHDISGAFEVRALKARRGN